MQIEQIKELATLAKIPDTVDGESLRRFAELIIEECVQLHETMLAAIDDTKVFNDHDRSWQAIRKWQTEMMINQIKAHFLK